MERAAEGKRMVHSATMDGGRLEKRIIANIKIAYIKLYINSFRITLFPYRAEFSRNAKNVALRGEGAPAR